MRSIRTGFTIFFVLAGFLAVFIVSLNAFSWTHDIPFSNPFTVGGFLFPADDAH